MSAQKKQPNTNTEKFRARVEGETIDDIFAELTYETIKYAQSFANGTWHPSRRTLFQIVSKFPQN